MKSSKSQIPIRRLLTFPGSNDLVSALLSIGQGGPCLEQGLSDLVIVEYAGTRDLEVKLLPPFRSDLLLQGMGRAVIPDDIARLGLDGDSFIRAQFDCQLLADGVDAVIFPLAPDMTQQVWQHKHDGYLLRPPDGWQQTWTAGQKEWFADVFDDIGLMTAASSRSNHRHLIQKAQQNEVLVLVVGISTIEPGANIYRPAQEAAKPFSWRAHEFNLALIQLSQELNVPVVDVDRLMAELGALKHVMEPLHYSAEGYRVIQNEIFRILKDQPLLVDNPNILQLFMPFIDSRYVQPHIANWHKREGDRIRRGELLFDVFIPQMTRQVFAGKNSDHHDSNHPLSTVDLTIPISAGSEGYLRRILAPAGATLEVGELAALLSIYQDDPLPEDLDEIGFSPKFQVIPVLKQEEE